MSTNSNAEHIKTIATDRETLLAYSIDGHMTADDILTVYTELLAAYKKHPKIDLMVKMSNFDGFDWSAIFTDTTYAAKTQSLTHIRKYAIVGAPSWISTIVSVFDPMFHVEMKTFELEQEADALNWLNEGSEELISQ